jgi:hypothetical protein
MGDVALNVIRLLSMGDVALNVIRLLSMGDVALSDAGVAVAGGGLYINPMEMIAKMMDIDTLVIDVAYLVPFPEKLCFFPVA